MLTTDDLRYAEGCIRRDLKKKAKGLRRMERKSEQPQAEFDALKADWEANFQWKLGALNRVRAALGKEPKTEADYASPDPTEPFLDVPGTI